MYTIFTKVSKVKLAVGALLGFSGENQKHFVSHFEAQMFVLFSKLSFISEDIKHKIK